MRIASVGLLCCFGLLAAGCGNSSTGGQVAARPLDLKGDPNQLVADAVGRQAVLTSLAGDGVLALSDAATNMNQRANAEIVAADGGKLRISGGRVGIHAFDLLMYNDNVVFHDAMNKQVFTGSVDDLRYLSLPIRPEELLNQLLKPASELIYMSWAADASRRADPSGTAAFVARDGRATYRALLDKRNSLLTRLEVYRGGNAAGTPYQVRTFGQYRVVDKTAVARGAARSAVEPSVFAYAQRIDWPADRRHVEFTFKRVVTDAPVDQTDFNVSFSPKAERIPLSRLAGTASAAGGYPEVSMR